MHEPGSVPLAGWIAISIRWLFLLAAGIVLALAGILPVPAVVVLLAAGFGNAWLTWRAARGNAPPSPYFGLAGDFLAAHLLFALSGSKQSPVSWLGILPLATAALSFGIRGAQALIFLNLLFQGLLVMSARPDVSGLVLIGELALLYIAGGLVASLVHNRLASGETVIRPDRKGNPARTPPAAAPDPDRERSRTIYQLISALSATLNYQRVLETALDLSAEALSTPTRPADRLVSAALLFAGERKEEACLQVGAARRFAPSDLRLTFQGVAGLLGQAIEEGKPRYSQEIHKDPELGRGITLQSCRSAYCLPLSTGRDTYGVLLFAHPEPEFFTRDDCELLEIAGHQVVIALQNARLYQDLAQEKERMMEIQEEARKKMARDLHDGPTQAIAGIAMRVNYARRLMERDLKGAAEELFKIEDLARRTTKEIRHMLFTLRPLVLESQGLVAALESMAEKMRETYNQNVIIQADAGFVSQIEMGKAAVIFYIAEEAVNNARKHAQASHIWVSLNALKENIGLVEIKDDGVGFNLPQVDATYENRGSLGLVNMRERAELLNGALKMSSSEGCGVCIQVIFPLSEEAADLIRRGL